MTIFEAIARKKTNQFNLLFSSTMNRFWDPCPSLSSESFAPTVGQQHLMSAASVSQAEAHYVVMAEAVASYIPPRAPIGCEQTSGDSAMRPFVVSDAADDGEDDGGVADDDDDDEHGGDDRSGGMFFHDGHDDGDMDADDDDDDGDGIDGHEDEDDEDERDVVAAERGIGNDFAFLHHLALPANAQASDAAVDAAAAAGARARVQPGAFEQSAMLNALLSAFISTVPMHQRLREAVAAAGQGVDGVADEHQDEEEEQEEQEEEE
jgi:hypothetical protein